MVSPRAAEASAFRRSNYISLILKIRLLMSCRAHLQDSPVTVGVAVPISRQLAAVMPARPWPRARQRWTEHNSLSFCPKKRGGLLPAAVPCAGGEGEGVPPLAPRQLVGLSLRQKG